MASGDFLDLQTNLAILSGRSTAADLDEDLSLCKQVINESLLEIYRPVDGRAPEWARRTVALQFRAPLAIALGLTSGSRVVTGYAFPDDVIGSVVQVGSNFYRYAGKNGSAYTLVEPVSDTTGTYAATLYHICQPIPTDVSEVLGAPEWLGHGALSPMTDRETELYYRSNIRGDYKPDWGLGYYGATFAGLTGTSYPQGDPIFYRLESDTLLDGAEITRRFCIIPMPQQLATISFRAQVFPVELVADADRPKIVGDLVTRCLLPIARAKWGTVYKKYTGMNQKYLEMEADKARMILTNSAKPQKRFSGSARPGMR